MAIQRIHPKILDLRRQFINRAITHKGGIDKLIAPPIVSPGVIALQYVSRALKIQKTINDRTLKYMYQLLAHEAMTRSDSFDDELDNTFSDLERYMFGLLGLEVFGLAAYDTADKVIHFNNKRYEGGIYGVMGLNNVSASDIAGLKNSWIRENVSLITAANTAQLSKLESMFRRASRDGMSRGVLIGEVKSILGATESRASLIADDQTYKLDGQIDRFKQQSIGLRTYIWRTMLDNRVRPKHMALEGKRRSWSSDWPHPGQEIRCRCWAQPDLKRFFNQKG